MLEIQPKMLWTLAFSWILVAGDFAACAQNTLDLDSILEIHRLQAATYNQKVQRGLFELEFIEESNPPLISDEELDSRIAQHIAVARNSKQYSGVRLDRYIKAIPHVQKYRLQNSYTMTKRCTVAIKDGKLSSEVKLLERNDTFTVPDWLAGTEHDPTVRREANAQYLSVWNGSKMVDYSETALLANISKDDRDILEIRALGTTLLMFEGMDKNRFSVDEVVVNGRNLVVVHSELSPDEKIAVTVGMNRRLKGSYKAEVTLDPALDYSVVTSKQFSGDKGIVYAYEQYNKYNSGAGEIYFPGKVTRTNGQVDENGDIVAGKFTRRLSYIFSKVDLVSDISDETFNVEFLPGTEVSDAVNSIRYTIGVLTDFEELEILGMQNIEPLPEVAIDVDSPNANRVQVSVAKESEAIPIHGTETTNESGSNITFQVRSTPLAVGIGLTLLGAVFLITKRKLFDQKDAPKLN